MRSQLALCPDPSPALMDAAAHAIAVGLKGNQREARRMLIDLCKEHQHQAFRIGSLSYVVSRSERDGSDRLALISDVTDRVSIY
jgi:hypothetical protein